MFFYDMFLKISPENMVLEYFFFIIKCILFNAFAIIVYGDNYSIKDMTSN